VKGETGLSSSNPTTTNERLDSDAGLGAWSG